MTIEPGEALEEFARFATAITSYDDMMSLVAQQSLAALDADMVSLCALDVDGDTIRPLGRARREGVQMDPSVTDPTRPYDCPTIRRVLDSGAGFAASVDELDDPDLVELLRSRGMASCVAAPLFLNGEVWGQVLAMRAPDREAFGAAELGVAEAVASRVVVGVSHAEQLAQIERLAFRDPLTGLANRRNFEIHLDSLVQRYLELGTDVAVAFIDVNGLHDVNRRDGFAAGDAALVAVAALLADVSELIPGSVCARIGGDEFCLLTAGVSTGEVVRALTILQIDADEALPHGVSVGIASTEDLPRGLDSAAQLMRLADAAQNRAKRGRYAVPVVSGREMPGHELRREQPERREFRESAVDHGQLLATSVGLLAQLSAECARVRLAAVAAHLAEAVEAPSWYVLERESDDAPLVVREGAVRRLAAGTPAEAKRYTQEVFGRGEFPATHAVADVAGICIADVSMGSGDPADLVELALEGAEQMVIVGGRDARSHGWVAEVHLDALGAAPEDFGELFLALVAVALVGAEACEHSHPRSSLDERLLDERFAS